MKSFSFNALPDKTDVPKVNTGSSDYNTAETVPQKTLKALVEIFNTIGKNLMWFFMPAWVIGLYYRFRDNVKKEELFIVTAFVTMNVAMMVLRYCYFQPHVSQRWALPLVSITVFYIPIGLKIMGVWIANNLSKHDKPSDEQRAGRPFWFYVLLIIGIVVCLPKLFGPVRIEKQGYKEAAKWLMENTAREDIIVVPDRRIAFYAKRTMKTIRRGTSTVLGGEVSSENWHHLVGTFDGKYQKLYIDGELVASVKPGFSNLGSGQDDLAIGKLSAKHFSHFQGLIAEVRLYSTALSDEDIEALHDRGIPAAENEKLIGCWTLEGEASGMNDQPGGAMRFNGTSDYIDLSHLGASLNVNELSVSVWTKPEWPNQWNWIAGNAGQFRIGNRRSEVSFWIEERPPGHTIPTDAAYVVAFAEEGSNEKEMRFTKRVREKYSVWANKREKKRRIVIYEVL